jgi:replication factor C subunit 2/4
VKFSHHSDVIRNKVKKFAQISVGQKPIDCEYPLPPFKVIILDEADSMTREAQAALRRTMEKYSKVTRFCLICNYISKIIEPLTSRCAKFRFKPLESTVLTERLESIAKKDSIEASKETFEEIINVSVGDLRRAITLLQSGKMMYGNVLTSENIKQIAGVVPTNLIIDFVKATGSNNFDKLRSSVDVVIKEGFSSKQFIFQLSDFLITCKEFNDEQKGRISIFISEIEKNLIDGADDSLQLLSLASYMMRNQ